MNERTNEWMNGHRFVSEPVYTAARSSLSSVPGRPTRPGFSGGCAGDDDADSVVGRRVGVAAEACVSTARGPSTQRVSGIWRHNARTRLRRLPGGLWRATTLSVRRTQRECERRLHGYVTSARTVIHVSSFPEMQWSEPSIPFLLLPVPNCFIST